MYYTGKSHQFFSSYIVISKLAYNSQYIIKSYQTIMGSYYGILSRWSNCILSIILFLFNIYDYDNDVCTIPKFCHMAYGSGILPWHTPRSISLSSITHNNRQQLFPSSLDRCRGKNGLTLSSLVTHICRKNGLNKVSLYWTFAKPKPLKILIHDLQITSFTNYRYRWQMSCLACSR